MTGMSLWQLIFISLSFLVFCQALSDGTASSTASGTCEDDGNVLEKGGLVERSPMQTINTRPYPTMSPTTKPYCFREHNENSHFQSFDVQEWQEALNALCSQRILNPDDGLRSYVSPKGIVAWGSYAQDQSGCSAKSAFDFTQPCVKWMKELVEKCDGPMPHGGAYGYGGGFIQPSPNGCIEIYISKSK